MATTSISNLETKRINDVETKLTNPNRTINALILTTAAKTMQALDSNKQPLREWLKKANVLCRAQYGHDCDKIEVDIGSR